MIPPPRLNNVKKNCTFLIWRLPLYIGFCRSTWIRAKYCRASLLDSFPPSGTLKAPICELLQEFVKLHLVVHSMVIGSSDLDGEPQQGHHQRVCSCVCILHNWNSDWDRGKRKATIFVPKLRSMMNPVQYPQFIVDCREGTSLQQQLLNRGNPSFFLKQAVDIFWLMSWLHLEREDPEIRVASTLQKLVVLKTQLLFRGVCRQRGEEENSFELVQKTIMARGTWSTTTMGCRARRMAASAFSFLNPRCLASITLNLCCKGLDSPTHLLMVEVGRETWLGSGQ